MLGIVSNTDPLHTSTTDQELTCSSVRVVYGLFDDGDFERVRVAIQTERWISSQSKSRLYRVSVSGVRRRLVTRV